LFKKVKTLYHGIKGDFVYEGLPLLRNLGYGMIGDNPNAKPNRGNLSVFDAHSEANQNINNLKYVYYPGDEKSRQAMHKVKEILMNMYPDSKGVRVFNEVNPNSEGE
ncbi:hypothetical protein, partial [Basilea psittacipulmonis]